MDDTARDQKVFSDPWATDLPGDLKLHLTLQDEDQIIGGMSDILPPLPRQVDPEVTTEPSLFSSRPTTQKDSGLASVIPGRNMSHRLREKSQKPSGTVTT